jgi:CelD/BcsL family acetyltransferase involved in cellulose biosynthesis
LIVIWRSTTPSEIEIISTADRLQAIEPEWAGLFERCPAAPPFLHPAWQLSWWQVFGSCGIHTIALYRDYRLAALAACFHYEERLVFIGNGISDQLDILAEDERAAEEIVNVLSRDHLDLQEIAEDSPLLRLPHEQCSVCPVLNLSQPVPKIPRRNVRTAQKRLEARGAAQFCFSREPDLLNDLFRLHSARWQSQGESGVLADARTEAFHQLAAVGIAAAGMLRMHALKVDDALIGVVYAFARNGVVYSYLGGFDPEWLDYSPGTLTISAAIEHARAAGDRIFDFLRGAEAYKYTWGATDRPQYRTISG